MPLLGCIADDFTGATDLGSMLVSGGMRCVQWLGTPDPMPSSDNIDAIIVSLKSRSTLPEEAIRDSLAALAALQRVGCERFFFKYCSTFDSTAQGNIGPVTEALLKALGAEQTLFCPAFPENGRTVYQGHLFVEGVLLNESGMENHPLNPMADANLLRILAQQSHGQVGLVSYREVDQGPQAIREQLACLASEGTCLVIADALSETHLDHWASVVQSQTLVTGGSAIARSLAKAYRAQGLLDSEPVKPALPKISGRAAVLAGSCSSATQRQVAEFAKHRPVFQIDPQHLLAGESVVSDALAWMAEHLESGPILIASTAAPDKVRAIRSAAGDQASVLVENALAQIAAGLVEQGVRRLIVAGGETSGAVLQTLGVSALKIGPLIDPGVPWTESLGTPKMALALKSGNFGSDDLFMRALEMLG